MRRSLGGWSWGKNPRKEVWLASSHGVIYHNGALRDRPIEFRLPVTLEREPDRAVVVVLSQKAAEQLAHDLVIRFAIQPRNWHGN